MNISKEGLYLINKPRGRSSFSIVAQVRRVSGIKKVGHAGTLDPEAEGLLVVLVGKDFTKKAEQYSSLELRSWAPTVPGSERAKWGYNTWAFR